jgi:hypothetical protein
MNRITGSTTISLNVDVLASGPWDARSIIPYYTGLTDNVTLPYPYKGMVVTVYNDPDIAKNGVYYCTNKGTNIPFANSDATWTKVGSDSQTITGNSWTYSSDTLNLLYSTGGTIPITGFTFVNTTGDTILGQLTISANTNPLILSGLTGSTSSVDTNTKFLTLDQFNNVIYQTGVTSTVITGNTWTYSSDTLNLQMSTGGTIPLTGFTFVNTTGDTILGKLIISANTNPLNLSGLTGSTSAATIDTKFLTLDEFNNVIYQTGLTASLPYTGGTSSAGTLGTTAITATLIVADETTGTTIDLSGAFTYTNSNATTADAGGIEIGTSPFVGGKTIHEIIQMIFYPSLAPTYNPQRSLTLVVNPPVAILALIDGVIPTVTLNATFVRGQYSALSQPNKLGGLPTAYEYQGPGIVTNYTAYTSNLTSSTGITNYTVTQGYNTWSATTYYGVGDVPVYSDGSPYYFPEFTNAGNITNTDRIEGVHPIFATTNNIAIMTQQPTLYSMINKPSASQPIQLTLLSNNNPAENYQRFAVPQDMGQVDVISWYSSPSNSYVPEDINIYWTISSVQYNVTSGANNVDYYLYTYNGGPAPKSWRDETTFKIYYT